MLFGINVLKIVHMVEKISLSKNDFYTDEFCNLSNVKIMWTFISNIYRRINLSVQNCTINPTINDDNTFIAMFCDLRP